MPSERSLERLLGERLRGFRLREGFTQLELAQRVAGGVDLSYIGRIERGEQLPSLKVLQKLARALGVSIGAFFEHEPDDLVGGARRSLPTFWRVLQQVPPQDVAILRAVARLLARRRGPAAPYRKGRPADRLAAERQPRYRKGRARRSAR